MNGESSYKGVVPLYWVVLMLVMVFVSNHRVVKGGILPERVNMKEVERLHGILNKPAIKTIESVDGDVIDCIDILKQPAFDHPLLQNHSIQMRPSFYPKGIETEANVKGFHQSWHLNGRCPKGTVPIRRTQKSDLIRSTSLKHFGKKYPGGVVRTEDGQIDHPGQTRAMVYVGDGNKHLGAKAEFTLWNPRVESPSEFSSAKVMVHSLDVSESLEVGWLVYPNLFGDNRTRLFAYWTPDGFATGCYNILCPGFVQVDTDIALGLPILPVSVYDGPNYHITASIFKDKDKGNWWIHFQGKNIGYWPSSLLPGIADGVDGAQYGGEVFESTGRSSGHTTTTEMGSGHFPGEGDNKAARFLNVEVGNPLTYAYESPEKIGTFITSPGCYDLQTLENDQSGKYFFYGGPGKSKTCP